jgi:hypothetical protein
MLVFYSPGNLERLANAQTIFMDGTFSVAPHPCKQLYTIRVPFKDVTVTAVYAFLPNKCQDLLFQPSHMFLVLASPLTVASCTFIMAGGNIGGLRLKTRRTD